MANLQLLLQVLSLLLLFPNTLQQNFSAQLVKEIGQQTNESYALPVFNIKLILSQIYVAQVIDNDANLERDLIIGQGASKQASKELENLGLKYKKAWRSKLEMVNKVAASQEPLSKKLDLVSDLLVSSAKKYDVGRDVNDSKTLSLNKWMSEKQDEVQGKIVVLKKTQNGNRIAAISGMSVNLGWIVQFDSQVNRYFTKGYGTEKSIEPLCVPMLHSFSLLETMATNEASGIFIPFSAAHMGMLVLLPRKGVTCQDILNNLDSQIKAKLSLTGRIHLILPIFKFEFEHDISKILEKVDTAGMFEKFKFSSKTNITIDEFPIKTVVQFKSINSLNKVKDIKTRNTETFEVNRSFVFIIKDKDTIYSVGRIENLDGLAAEVNCSKE
ncbi:accessory gland protein Acp76A [Drosophila subpulchrella]|uniref:accessory gland protein Acp76A n=1 Tax=Drosophila subpulchrella TaxID=1486046 RepID=UPI0018A1B66C|nr:accessory gland protein Acp76A [Drosophila subpulchrella]